MIGEALRGHRPFGVVLIKQGQEANGPLAVPHPVGCTAEITRVEPVGGGRFFVQALGRERFRIRRLDHSAPYLQADVETVPLPAAAAPLANSALLDLRRAVLSYLRLLNPPNEGTSESEELPTEPLALAYVSAGLLDIPLAEKQSLLEAEDVRSLLSRLYQIYRRELAIYRLVAGRATAGEQLIHLN
jgi:Lon protease-like protein